MDKIICSFIPLSLTSVLAFILSLLFLIYLYIYLSMKTIYFCIFLSQGCKQWCRLEQGQPGTSLLGRLSRNIQHLSVAFGGVSPGSLCR